GPINNPTFGITNGRFDVQPGQAGFGWSVRGQASVAGGAAVLEEDARVTTALTQPFFVPAGVTTLRFTIVSAALGAEAGQPPDAFEVALLNATTLQPLVGTAVGLTGTDAFLNAQSDGRFFAGPGVSVSGLGQGGTLVGPGGVRLVQLDIRGVPANTLAVLSF